MKKDILKVVAVVGILVLFLSIAVNVKNSKDGILFDEKIMQRVHENTSPTQTSIMKAITFLGSSYFFIAFGGILLFLFIKNKYYEGIIPLVLSVLGTYLVNAILKNIFTRTRPLKYFLIEQGGYSFPSGHAMVSMAFYSTMTYLILKDKNKTNKNIFIWILNFLLIGLIGFSRIYLGVHWPTDILAGYMMGFLSHICIVNFAQKVDKNMPW